MIKYLKLIVPILMLVIFFRVSSAQAMPVELYINSRPYGKAVFENKHVLYAAVDEVLPFAGIKVIRKGRLLCGVSSSYKGPACPESQSPALLFLDGKPILQGVLVHRDRPWISLPLLARTLGYRYQFNAQTGIADLTSLALVTLAINAPSIPSEHKKNEMKKESKDKDKISKDEDAISAEVEAPESDIYSTENPGTYEIRTNFTLVNQTDHPVNGVAATLNYLDGYGNSLVSHPFNIGTMAAHATVKQEDYWINYTGVSNPRASVDVTWEGKKKE